MRIISRFRRGVGGLLQSIVDCESQALSVAAWRALQLRFYAQKKRKPVVLGPKEWLKADREKWQPDLSLDAVLKRDEELGRVLSMKDFLANTPGMQMDLKTFLSHRWDIGLLSQRPSAWLRKYPKIFQATTAAWLEFTPEAREQVAREKQFWKENEGLLVDKLRKLLMMSPGRQISLEVVGQLKKSLGLPEDFRSNLVNKYPQYFRVVELRGPHLELTEWDPELAVTSFEKIVESPAAVIHDPRDQRPKDWLHWLSFNKKWNLSRKSVFNTVNFHKAPFVTPYCEHAQDLDPSSLEAEKHAVAVLHELLSFTLLKRNVLGRVAHLKPLFHVNKSIRSVCVQHPELFYISMKRGLETAFLRGAYRNSELVVEDPFLSAQAWVAAFMEKGKQLQVDQAETMSPDEGDSWETEEDKTSNTESQETNVSVI